MCKIWGIKKYSRKSVTVMLHGVHNNSWNIQNVGHQAISMDLKRPSWKFVVSPGLYVQYNSFPEICWKAKWLGGRHDLLILPVETVTVLSRRSCSSSWRWRCVVMMWIVYDRQNPVQPPSHCHSCQAVQLNPNLSLHSSLACSGVLHSSWGGSQYSTAYMKEFAGSS